MHGRECKNPQAVDITTRGSEHANENKTLVNASDSLRGRGARVCVYVIQETWDEKLTAGSKASKQISVCGNDRSLLRRVPGLGTVETLSTRPMIVSS